MALKVTLILATAAMWMILALSERISHRRPFASDRSSDATSWLIIIPLLFCALLAFSEHPWWGIAGLAFLLVLELSGFLLWLESLNKETRNKILEDIRALLNTPPSEHIQIHEQQWQIEQLQSWNNNQRIDKLAPILRALGNPNSMIREEAFRTIQKLGDFQLDPISEVPTWLHTWPNRSIKRIANYFRQIITLWKAYPSKDPEAGNLVLKYLMNLLTKEANAELVCKYAELEVKNYGKKVRKGTRKETSLGPKFFVADDDWVSGGQNSSETYKHIRSTRGGDYYASVTIEEIPADNPIPFSIDTTVDHSILSNKTNLT